MRKKVESIELIFENSDWIKINSEAIKNVCIKDFYLLIKIEYLTEEDYLIAKYFSMVIDTKKLAISRTDYGINFIDKIQDRDLTQVQINYQNNTKKHFYIDFEGKESNSLQENKLLNNNLAIMIGEKNG